MSSTVTEADMTSILYGKVPSVPDHFNRQMAEYKPATMVVDDRHPL